MYFGILSRYRDGLRNSAVASARESWLGVEMAEPEHQPEKKSINSDEQIGLNMSDRQALSFFTIASQALAEEIKRVQRSMIPLAESSNARGWLSPFCFLVSGIPSLWRRLKVIFTAKMEQWEVQFALALIAPAHNPRTCALFSTHGYLWGIRISVDLYIRSPGRTAQRRADRFYLCHSCGCNRNWCFFEFFIFLILSFGLNSFLNAVGRKSSPAVQYAIIPYIFVVTITFLNLMPPSMSYASFLVVLTNAVLLFCPRATADCSKEL